MSQTIDAIAAAFSRHEFEATYAFLAADVRWQLIGGDLITGKQAVIARCTESAAYVSGVSTIFTRFRVIVAETSVVVDSEATYTETTGDTSVVAACDIYDFEGGKMCCITSYNVALAGAE